MKFDAFISKVRGQIKNIAVVAGVNSSEYFKKTVENINEMLNIVSSVGFFTLLGNTTEKLDRLKTLITEIDAENYVPKILFPQEKGRLDTEIDHHSAQLVQLALDCLPELPKIEDAIIQSSLKKYEKEIQQLEKILRNRIYRYNYNCRHNPIFSELKKLTDPLTLYQVQLGKLEAVALPELCSNLKTILEDSLSIAGKVLSFPSRVSYFRQDEASDDQNNPDIIGKKVGAQVFDNLQNLLFKISCIIANAIGGDNTQKIQEELMRGQSPSTSILNDLIIANSDALLKDDKQALNNLLQLIENVESELGNISKVHKQQMSGYDCQKSWQYNIFHNVKELKIALETQFPDSKKNNTSKFFSKSSYERDIAQRTLAAINEIKNLLPIPDLVDHSSQEIFGENAKKLSDLLSSNYEEFKNIYLEKNQKNMNAAAKVRVLSPRESALGKILYSMEGEFTALINFDLPNNSDNNNNSEVGPGKSM